MSAMIYYEELLYLFLYICHLSVVIACMLVSGIIMIWCIAKIKGEKMIKENETIKYTSPNGYTGMLYGESSLSIYDPSGKECLHTGFRNVNTYDELVELVDGHPKFIEMINSISKDDLDEDYDI